MAQIYPAAVLCAQHFDGHGAFRGSYLTPKVCYSSPALRSDGSILSISNLKTTFAINSFALQGGPVFPVALLGARGKPSTW